MDGLVEFVTARLDEDEAAADAGARRVGMPWRVDPKPWDGDTGIVDDLGRVANAGGRYAAEHIARHDPARVLREVAAKRAILAEVVPAIRSMDRQIISEWGGGEPDEHLPLLKIMAAVYGDHPDYRQEWAP